MKELAQVRDAVITALDDAGIVALVGFPDQKAKQYRGAVATVSVGAAEGKTMGFCNYLGEVYDEVAGTVTELYGKQLECDVIVVVRAGKAADCQMGCEAVTEVLMGQLPTGIRPGELRWEELKWERATEMFLRQGLLHCQSIFTACGRDDGEFFTDFILKGAMQK